MRCSTTGTFASYDEAEAESDGADLDGTQVEVSFRIFRPCAECGSEAAEYSDTATGEIDHQCPAPAEGEDDDEAEPEFEVLSESTLEVSDGYKTTDRRGRQIANPRYQKHIFGVEATVDVRCQRCSEEFEVIAISGEIPASWFEDTGH